MPVSGELADEIFTILAFHITAVIVLFSAAFYIFLRAKKTLLLYSFLAVVSMLLLWMTAKIFKTVSPNETMRWVFIVLQYFGVQFLGFFLLIFACLYTGFTKLTKAKLTAMAVFPALSFLVVATNPLHMLFYSYYDFYKDVFGPLFLPTQCISYIYILASVALLASGYANQPGFRGKKWLARLTAAAVLFPLIGNVYYILYKLIKPMPWIFSFPAFDFTPIAGSISLILFMIPALKFKFFDMMPISYKKLFEHMPQGIVFINKSGGLYSKNRAFYEMFGESARAADIDGFVGGLGFTEENRRNAFIDFINGQRESGTSEISLGGEITYKVIKNGAGRSGIFLRFIDISGIINNKKLLEEKNKQLTDINDKLGELARSTGELAVIKLKTQVSQDMHDILGHSLTVVLGTAELAARDGDTQVMREKMNQAKTLLQNSLCDMRESLEGREQQRNQSSLTRAIGELENGNISIDFSSQGQVYELGPEKTQAVFAMCREAVTNSIRHGAAKTIHIILRYKERELEVFAIDDGCGCRQIDKHMGLSGIERRIDAVSGHIIFASNGEKGFTLHAFIPRD